MKDTKELRAFLVDQMERVASGELDETKAKGVANLSQQIYNTLNIESKLAAAKERLGENVEINPVSFSG